MDIMGFLNKEKNARKIFGKREIKIIEKQLFGLNLTQSERNRLSRDIRKKLEFIRDINKYFEIFDLKHGAIIKEIIEEAVELIKNDLLFPKIKKIILFGSTVEKTRHFGSDIDIAVEFYSISKEEATKFRIKISGRLNNKVDIQVYNILPEKLKKEVNKKGKILYER